jgi:hypothetical protein
MSNDNDRTKRTPRGPGRPLTRKPQTHREQYVAWLNQQQSTTQVPIKKGTNEQGSILPMLPSKASLLLAVYDGIIPASPEQLLNVALQEFPRNPRKGTIPPWPISDA